VRSVAVLRALREHEDVTQRARSTLGKIGPYHAPVGSFEHVHDRRAGLPSAERGGRCFVRRDGQLAFRRVPLSAQGVVEVWTTGFESSESYRFPGARLVRHLKREVACADRLFEQVDHYLVPQRFRIFDCHVGGGGVEGRTPGSRQNEQDNEWEGNVLARHRFGYDRPLQSICGLRRAPLLVALLKSSDTERNRLLNTEDGPCLDAV
jgi:hypothetical protein